MFILNGENNNSRRRIPVHLVNSSDGITALTGQTGTAKVSINYAAPNTTVNSLVEIDSTNMPGDYYLELTPLEVKDLGMGLLRVKTGSSAEYVYAFQVIAYDPFNKLYGENASPLLMGGGDISYSKVRTIVAEEIAKIPKYEAKEPDFMPISQALQAILSEVRAIDIPEAEETDLKPLMAKIETVEGAVRSIRIPVTDLSPVLQGLQDARAEVKPGVEATRADLEALLARIKEFFTADINAIKAEVQKIEKRLARIPMLVMNNQPEEPAPKPKFEAPKLI